MDSLDELLDSPLDVDTSPLIEIDDSNGEIDPRFKLLSYSSSLVLHGCARKYQLTKLKQKMPGDGDDNLDFAFGHAVGDGLAELFITGSLDKAILKAFLGWKPDFLAEDDKRMKSFAYAVFALTMLDSMRQDGFLAGYKVKYFDGKPAAELGFTIDLTDGFADRGFVDIVLEHEITGEIKVLEIKTDSGNYINHYKYKNSSQALSYSVVLDKIANQATSYTVQYLVYMTKLFKYETFEFPKTFAQRAMFLRDIIYDVDHIKNYVANEGNYGIWPMHGEFCTSFNRVCEFMDMCHMNTEQLMVPLRQSHIDAEANQEYAFHLTLEELLAQEHIQNEL